MAMESSECTSRNSGWQPHHLLISTKGNEKQPVAILPLYLKYNSYGEYVFDWSWADAYNRHDLAYYPKLLSAMPFTPSTGPRLCLADGADETQLLEIVVAALKQESARLHASGWHILFPDKELSDRLVDLGAQQRLGCQYQWFNRDYPDFNAFLASFNSRKRKSIRKEREQVWQAGVSFRHLRGSQITETHWQHFYRFYSNTYHVRGRTPYLNRQFFMTLGATMPDDILLVIAEFDGQPIAGALSFIGSDTLYGRYWGSDDEYRFLHFETCYYQGIEFCLAQGLNRFDSGAQGEHKIQRGFEPVPTWSNHWLAHAGFRDAIGEFLSEEERYLRQYITHAGTFLPFRQED